MFHASDGLTKTLRLTDIPGLASSTVIVSSFVVHARSVAVDMLLSPKSKVGLTVKTFIEIMRCRILNSRLRQSTLSFTPAVPLRASTSKYSAE